MDLGLKERSVVVTGGGSNIGRAIVLAFAREGAAVTIGDIDPGQAEKTAEAARAAGAAGVQVIPTDITQRPQVEAMFGAATERFGPVTTLVNNVGWDRLMFFTETTPEFWHQLIQVNYVGVLHCTQVALQTMIPNKGGAIVSISSDASRQGEPREAVYGGLKAAINSFMKTIAKENGRYGVRCNVVCPGLTMPESQGEVGDTSMWRDASGMFTPEQVEKIAKTLPLRKIGRPDDIANAVAFLASPLAAGHITGQVLSVSGGYSMVG